MTTISPVVEAYTGAPIVRAGKFASARIILHGRAIVRAPPSVDDVTAIPRIPRASPVAAAATLISTSSHRESSLSSVTRSQKAIVAPPVPVTVIPLYLPSAEPAGSSPMEAFSANRYVPAASVPATIAAAGSHVQFVRVPDAGVPSIGVTKVLLLIV